MGPLRKFTLGIRRELAEKLIEGELEQMDYGEEFKEDTEFFADGSYIKISEVDDDYIRKEKECIQ